MLARLVLVLVVTTLILSPISGQTTAPVRDPQALNLIASSLKAVTGSVVLTDASLQGTANVPVGDEQETGSFALEVKGNQESKLVLNLNSGTLQEIRQWRAGVWINTDGQKDVMAVHNCWTDASVLLPVFTLQTTLGDQQTSALYLGRTILGGAVVDHVQLSHLVAGQGQKMAVEIQSLSAMDLYLDVASHLPVAIAFATHPNDDLHVSIPVQIQFSAYKQIGGIQAPTRMQKFMQGTLVLELVVASVATNSGVTDLEFSTE
jgi:hypothetical protein